MAKQKQESKKPPPRCKAVLLCRRAILDRFTEEMTVVGLIDAITLDEMPGETEPSTLFLMLVDGIGRYQIRIEVHDLAENSIVAIYDGGSVEFGERPNRMDLLLSIPSLYLQHEGSYDLIVFADENEIDRTLFRVRIGGQSDEEEAAEAPEGD